MRRPNVLPDDLEFEFKREDILARLRINLETHREEYDTALQGYWLEVEEQAKNIASKARALAKEAVSDKKPENFHGWSITARRPEDHSKDYERVIDMLELAQETTIKLNEHTFATYVRDEWEWKQDFLATSAFYSGKFSERLSS